MSVAILLVSDLWPRAIEVMHADVFNFEQHPAASCDAGIIQVFQNFVLRVNRDSFSIGELPKINSVTAAPEAQLDPMVNQAFGFYPLANPHLGEQIDRSLLQHAGTDTLLRILAAAIFNDDGVNPLQISKVREHEASRPGANNPDLGSQ